MTSKPTYIIDAETIHNWTTRWADMSYFKTLPMDIRLDIEHANKAHYKSEKTAGEWADELARKYPGIVIRGGCLNP